MRLINKQLFKLASLLLGLGLTVVIIILLNLNSAAVNNELVALDLIPKPEKLTELYFENSAIPASATGSQAISFTFVIHNLETTDYQYAYDVVVIAKGGRHVVDSGNVLVKNNQSFVKKEEISLVSSPGRQDVVVELVDLRQSIDFWVENTGGR